MSVFSAGSSLRFLRAITFDEFCRSVCHCVPEASFQSVRDYLMSRASPPYDRSSVSRFASEIEAIMIDEGSI